MEMPEKEENQLDKEGNGQGNVEEIMEKEKLYIKINMEQEEGIMNIIPSSYSMKEREERMLTILREKMQRKEKKEPKEEEDGSSEKQTIENIEEKNIENLK